MKAVLDTNVMIVAHSRPIQASPYCVKVCAQKLNALKANGIFVLDEGWHILKEYLRRKAEIGEVYFEWIITNYTNPERCERHPITPAPGQVENYLEFPVDPGLGNFDPQDRKFAALAVVSGAPVWNAVDRHWWEHREALQRNGILIEFLCPDFLAAKE